ncbi:DUF4492 domain-containing protein [Poseidonibacter lekithochrous]|uniref:DUF4492 domain-containing protein n=1 Tax=Poseidonibacter TaxID=2321187 RepID=UPI000C983056|nr:MULTISPECIES: DUF4492 domain-containing protein [Poseidonibacter]MAD42415.1 DUF4492 domain-containing protein [Arcobacter sp.]MBU3013868.1 DUF4492 domain-containing protein [Poseidonibacter lekithochrous]MDO6827162.1 DUF4492 domain-containing protein [Poseidonibacter sp. 1_MG-2023]
MLNLKNIYSFYINGFKNMTIGKTLWKLILIKLLVIFLFLNYFVHDKSLKTEYKTYDEKVDFVYKNLTKDN